MLKIRRCYAPTRLEPASDRSRLNCPMPDHGDARRCAIALGGADDFVSRFQNRFIVSLMSRRGACS